MKSEADLNYLMVVSITVLLIAAAGVYASIQPAEDPSTPEEQAQACYNNTTSPNNLTDPSNLTNSTNYSKYYDDELKACLDPSQFNRS